MAMPVRPCASHVVHMDVAFADSTNSRYNDRHLTGVQAFCAVLYTIAYALREYGAFNYLYSTPNLACFIISEVFIYISPCV